eukprot:GFUD01007234.1.p1 GENE.GFUD01007234.1~~GFUD01007234.1.p1  ORF type:complete len:172 (-),score=37.72 GFUD01007234.1:75-590(-)
MTLLPVLLSSFLLATVSSLSVEKAASPYTNLGCQCSSLTFVDSVGQIQGNCRSVDHTGAQWCYVDSLHSSCQDQVFSPRFPNNPWSYEACATPAALYPSAPLVGYPHHVPVSHPHPVPAHLHPVPAHHQPSHVVGHPVYPGHPQPFLGAHNIGTLPTGFTPKKSASQTPSK